MTESAFGTLLHPDFYGSPIVLETEPDQEFLGFLLEFDPFALRYSPPRDLNQVIAPFSASPLHVQLSGFVSRLFLAAKCGTVSRILLPCTDCAARLDSKIKIWWLPLARFADTCTPDHCGEKLN